MNSKNLTALILSLGMVATLTACEEQSEKDMVMEAQYCLDKSDASSAQACLSSISGLQSAQANALRCAAGFISAGVTSTANLSAAFTAIQNNNSAGTTTLLAALDFSDSTDVNDSTASKTANYCNLSNQPGLALIGAMARSATVLASATNMASCSGSGDPLGCAAGELETTINSIVTDYNTHGQNLTQQNEETVTAIVSAVQTVYAATCGTNSGSSDICGPINTAIAQTGVNISTTDPAELVALGLELLQKWK